MSRGLRENFDKGRAQLVDLISFGFVNLLQARHPVRPEFIERWKAFNQEWQGRSVEEYYQVPPGEIRPEMPHQGRLSFPSPYPGVYPQNNRAAFDFFPCAAGWTAPTMFIAHGLMSVSDVGYRYWARRLNACGWNAIFIHLPFHYSRRTPGHFHGELCITGDLLRSAAALRQSVVECRLVLDKLEAKGGRLFGGWGTSYGGWIMALLACTDARLQRLILVEPILDVHQAIWHCPSSVVLRHTLRRLKIFEQDTARSMRLVCPGTMEPKLRGEHILLLAGAYDKIAPPEDIEALHQRWQGSHYACFKQGHVGYTLMPESFRLAQTLWADDFSANSVTATPVLAQV